MHFNDLRTFLAVAENASFSHAARQLHITQPAVTKRVQALERSLAVQLFDRVGKRLAKFPGLREKDRRQLQLILRRVLPSDPDFPPKVGRSKEKKRP